MTEKEALLTKQGIVNLYRLECLTLAEAADLLDPDDLTDRDGDWMMETAPELYGALTYKRHLTHDRGIKLD